MMDKTTLLLLLLVLSFFINPIGSSGTSPMRLITLAFFFWR